MKEPIAGQDVYAAQGFGRAPALVLVDFVEVFAKDGTDAHGFSRKVPDLLTLTEHMPASQIVPALTPVSRELVVRKRLPSAFCTDGSGCRRVDTLSVAGCTTSGCVRATVVDAMEREPARRGGARLRR